jgi:hypothetical protein
MENGCVLLGNQCVDECEAGSVCHNLDHFDGNVRATCESHEAQ